MRSWGRATLSTPMDPPVVSVVVPTRGRAAYLEVTLDSLLAQRAGIEHEILVVDDGGRRRRSARRRSATSSHPQRRGAQRRPQHAASGKPGAADRVRRRRRAGAAGLAEALGGGRRAPPARPRPSAGRSGRASRAARRAAAGARIRRSPRSTWATADREADFVWGANFAVRRSAVERIGAVRRGDRAPARRRGGVAGAAAGGGRADRLPGGAPGSSTAAPPRTRACARWRAPPTPAAARRARATAAAAASRRWRGELRVLAGCGWHTLRRACPQGLIMGAHSAGRVVEALRRVSAPDYLSGDAGDVTNPWRRAKRALGELAFEAVDRATRRGPARRRAGARHAGAARARGRRLPARVAARRARARSARSATRCAARSAPPARRIPRSPSTRWRSGSAAASSRTSTGVLAAGAERVRLAAGRRRRRRACRSASSTASSAVCEHFGSTSPSPRRASAATRPGGSRGGDPASLVRETRFVEIGPLTAFGRRAAAELLPFPELRFGWGLDLHWAALAAERGWRLGVVDATPVRHEAARSGSRLPHGRRRRRPRRPASSPTVPTCPPRARATCSPPTGGRADAASVHRTRHAPRRRGAPVGDADPGAGAARRRGAAALPQRRGPAVRRGARRRRAGDLPAPGRAHRRRRRCAARSPRRAPTRAPWSPAASARSWSARRSPAAPARPTSSTSTRRSRPTASCSARARTSRR